MLTVVKRVDLESRKVRLQCKCSCGNLTVVYKDNLVSGHTTSCGCKRVKHGQNRTGKMTRTYCTWHSMKQRTSDTNCRDYARYGGRGILIEDPRWLEFENFYKDMGERPVGKTLDRKDNDKGYCKGNCRWATYSAQRRNQHHFLALRTK